MSWRTSAGRSSKVRGLTLSLTLLILPSNPSLFRFFVFMKFGDLNLDACQDKSGECRNTSLQAQSGNNTQKASLNCQILAIRRFPHFTNGLSKPKKKASPQMHAACRPLNYLPDEYRHEWYSWKSLIQRGSSCMSLNSWALYLTQIFQLCHISEISGSEDQWSCVCACDRFI